MKFHLGHLLKPSRLQCWGNSRTLHTLLLLTQWAAWLDWRQQDVTEIVSVEWVGILAIALSNPRGQSYQGITFIWSVLILRSYSKPFLVLHPPQPPAPTWGPHPSLTTCPVDLLPSWPGPQKLMHGQQDVSRGPALLSVFSWFLLWHNTVASSGSFPSGSFQSHVRYHGHPSPPASPSHCRKALQRPWWQRSINQST